MKTYPGTISWISSSAEFTQKLFKQKKNDSNLVYAVRLMLKMMAV
jgi:HlyD family secretion protein